MPGQIKQDGGLDLARGPCVCHLCLKGKIPCVWRGVGVMGAGIGGNTDGIQDTILSGKNRF